MSNHPVVEVPTDYLPALRERIAKLNKVADKLDCEPVKLTLGAAFTRKEQDPVTGQDIFVEYTPVTLIGEAPVLNGWRFVATLEHDEGGTLIRRLPTFGEEIDLTPYRTATPDNCDHCGYRRRRNDTYVVAYTGFPGEDHIGGYDRPDIGTTKQVGSSCLKDFTGHQSPERIARYVAMMRDLLEELASGGFTGERIIPRYDVHEFMDVAAHVVAQEGYVSRRTAEETGQQPTGDAARSLFHQLRRERRPDPLNVGSIDTDQVIEWVRSLNDRDLENDYLYNLYTVCKNDTITDRQFGIAASAITAYQRAEQRRIERQASNRVDEFLGEVGSRIEVTFKVTQVFHNDTDYGVQHKHIMLTNTGHRLSWRSTTYELEQGKTYRATFTVKDHYEGKYGKETQVNRPRKGEPVEV